MRDFAWLCLALLALMAMFVVGAALLIACIYATLAVNWLCALAFLLVPVWVASMIKCTSFVVSKVQVS